MSQDKDSKNKNFSTTTQSDNQDSPNRKLLKWSQEEDNKLLELVEIYGTRNWKKIRISYAYEILVFVVVVASIARK